MNTDQDLPRMRADARRNRQRVLEAAVEVFDEQGLEAQMEAVAHRAGVGMGTVYRSFPTKAALVQAVIALSYEKLLATAQSALAQEDKGQAFRSYVRSISDFQVRHRVLAQEMSAPADDPPETVDIKDALRAATAELLRRAQEAGDIRGDVDAEDLSLLLGTMARAIELAGDHPELLTRYVSLLLDGLDPTAATPLPPRL